MLHNTHSTSEGLFLRHKICAFRLIPTLVQYARLGLRLPEPLVQLNQANDQISHTWRHAGRNNLLV